MGIWQVRRHLCRKCNYNQLEGYSRNRNFGKV